MNLRLILGAGAAAALVLAGAPSSESSTPATPYEMTRMNAPHPQATGRWAERLVAARDLNDDGVNDFFVGALSQTIGANNNQGRAYAVSGRTFTVLYTIDSPEPQANANFAFYVSSPGDVNGDGKWDVVIGTDSQDVGANVDQGKAWAFSGANGALLYVLDNPVPQGLARFGSRIGRAGDINGDGVPDVIVGASGHDSPPGCGVGIAATSPLPPGCRVNQGQAFIFNGVNGALLRTLDIPVSDLSPPGTCRTNCGSLGLAVQGPGDTDGDGVVDQLVDASNYSTGIGCTGEANVPGCNEGQGRMYVFSGRTGQVLLRIDDPEPQEGATFGFQDAAPLSPGDVNGDGFADLYANGFAQNGPSGLQEGRGWVFNGKTGALLYTLRDPTPGPGGQFGWSMARTDYNRDGNPDLYVGSSPHHTSGSGISQAGGTYVFNGLNGALLKTLELPAADAQHGAPGNLGSNLGWGLAAPGDLNGDGQPDYLGGAPFHDVGANADEGVLFPFLSKGPAGYHLVATDGGIFSFGDARFAGSTGAIKLNKPVVGMASTPNFEGYWLVATDGGIFSFGDARFFGSTGAIRLNQPIVGMAPTPSGKGYWLVATDGGIFSFGDARFFGSTGAIRLNKPVVGMASTPSGNGYWLVASDGGIFSFGDARFFGSTGAITLNKPIVGMAGSPTGKGYWMVATDGGIFAFGDASFFGSTGAIRLNQPMVGMTPTPSGRGYNLVATDGGIFSFGDAKFLGSTGAIKLNQPVVGMAGVPPLTDF